jgi:hypothetical protein
MGWSARISEGPPPPAVLGGDGRVAPCGPSSHLYTPGVTAGSFTGVGEQLISTSSKRVCVLPCLRRGSSQLRACEVWGGGSGEGTHPVLNVFSGTSPRGTRVAI